MEYKQIISIAKICVMSEYVDSLVEFRLMFELK